MAETVAELNTFITATVATRLSIMNSMLDSMSTSETQFKHLQVDKLTEQINMAEKKVRQLSQTTRRFRGVRFYPVK